MISFYSNSEGDTLLLDHILSQLNPIQHKFIHFRCNLLLLLFLLLLLLLLLSSSPFSLPLLLLLLLLLNTTVLWAPWLLVKSISTPSSPRSLHASFLFPLPSDLLQPHQSIFSVVYVFSLLLPFWQSLFTSPFSLYPSSQCVRTLHTNCTISDPCNTSCTSLLVLILQDLSFFSGPQTFLTITL